MNENLKNRVMFKMIKKMVLLLLSLIIALATVSLVTLFICSPGEIKPFTDANGDYLAGSLAEKTSVEINGVEMGMIIKAKDVNKPVLLFLHGGPGLPEYWLNQAYPSGLEDHFTVVWWDQRGAGRSYKTAIPSDTVTTQQMIDDTIAVSNYLRNRFNQDKIFLMAHSGGSYIGIQAAATAPELYRAYIGVAQISNPDLSEKIAYDFMLDFYEQSDHHKNVNALKAAPYGTPGYDRIRDQMMHQAGIGTTRTMDSVFTGVFLAVMKNREYTVTEKVNIWRGKAFTKKTRLYQELWQCDLSKSLTRVDVPIYFFVGAYDYTVNRHLSEAYFEKIQAPEKHCCIFEDSAHSPIFEEPDRSIAILKELQINF